MAALGIHDKHDGGTALGLNKLTDSGGDRESKADVG